MLGLIMVASMVPGLLIGLQRTTAIDYDAVAYRTGAILTEDPGWPISPSWELLEDKISVERMGLAVSKESPDILSSAKIEKFKDTTFFFYPDDYRQRLIFGDYPYRFNLALKNNTGTVFSIGDPLPGMTGYGYIRRVVKIKGYSSATIDLNTTYTRDKYNVTSFDSPDIEQNFTIRLNMSELVDNSINPAYQFDPRIEPITILLKNFSAKLNNSAFNPVGANDTVWNTTAPDYATLSQVRFYKNPTGPNPPSLPFDYNVLDATKYSFKIADNLNNFGAESTLTPLAPSPTRVYNNTLLVIYPGTLPLDESTILDIKFIFDDTPSHTLINGTHTIHYCGTGEKPETHGCLLQQPLEQAWLEVAVW
jgi:hypothetical protein